MPRRLAREVTASMRSATKGLLPGRRLRPLAWSHGTEGRTDGHRRTFQVPYLGPRGALATCRLTIDAAETAGALLEVPDGLEQMLPAEVGPEHRREPQFRVGSLPQHEVGDP